jgi:hypothetical protein
MRVGQRFSRCEQRVNRPESGTRASAVEFIGRRPARISFAFTCRLRGFAANASRLRAFRLRRTRRGGATFVRVRGTVDPAMDLEP